MLSFVFFFNDTATTEIYTLSLHDALPISCCITWRMADELPSWEFQPQRLRSTGGQSFSICSRSRESTAARCMRDRKSTRLNSSHQIISYAALCLQKKKELYYLQQD